MNLSNAIVVDDVIDGLNELSNRELQERLWLSDGSSGDVSSFEEAVCSIFDDGGVTRALESNKLLPELEEMFDQLNEFIDEIPTNAHPLEIIEHPSMQKIKVVAESILNNIGIRDQRDA